MEKKPFERIELKILRLCDNIQLINNRIKLIPFNFAKSNPDRYVNSIYYDSHDLKLFHSNIFGLSPRFKIRLRWYNDLLETMNFNLERKSKQGTVGSKYQKPIELDTSLKDLNHFELSKLLQIKLNPSELIRFNYLNNPIIMVRYLRQYYESKIVNIRITVDSCLNFYSQLNSSSINLNLKKTPIHLKIIEIKCNKNLTYLSQNILQYLPYRVSKCSKYILGVKYCLK